MLSQTQILAFNAISTFVKSLNENYGKVQHSLALYSRLIEHMNLSQVQAISKVVNGFVKYISNNQEAIENCDVEKLTSNRVEYSEKVFIDMKFIFSKSDVETRNIIWRHLLTIYGILYPDSQAKEILKKMNSENKTPESALITDMVQKIVPHLNQDESNPMQAIMGLMTSGVFTDLVSTMQKSMDNGDIDMNSLMSQVGTMFANPALGGNKMLEEKKDT